MILNIYSLNFEVDSNPGMNGKVYLEDKLNGLEFKNIDEALNYICKNDIDIEYILYEYSKDGIQNYRKFKINSLYK